VPNFRLWPMAVLDPKPKHTTDRYQVVKQNDAIKIKATLSSRSNNTSAIDYLLAPLALTYPPLTTRTQASPSQCPLL